MEGWELAGQAWSERALDFAYLFESFARPAYQAVFDRIWVGSGTKLLDVACGGGYAAMMAAELGATVAGLDASAGLLEIARRRVPTGDFRTADMSALPFENGQFDAVSSFSGIAVGLEEAMKEAARVLRPGGLVGMARWGSPGGGNTSPTSWQWWTSHQPSTSKTA